jgi:4Fe-4S single cluster domain
MSTWQEFYSQIRDPSWPDCELESEFELLPESIRQECIENFGYRPGQFQKTSKLKNRRFPIYTNTACQLKWNWSTLFLTTELTASCHRTNHHRFNADTFDFHNTPKKLNDRKRMLQGQWPQQGCDYCRNIEQAGGQSDRLTNLDFPGIHAPPELDHDPNATKVTPRILEIYFDNTCNLKCVYCGPHFSSLWDAENVKFGLRPFNKSSNIERNKQKIFSWLKQHGHNLTHFNILGGEPLFQQEFDQCLDLFEKHPAPELKLQIFTNLNVKLERVQGMVKRVKRLIDQNCLREFEITASLDCWGPPQEYARFPLDLKVWEQNFEYLLQQSWINLIVSSTITPLTIKTLPDLLKKLQTWNQTRTVYHYQNSVNSPDYMFIDIFGDIFSKDFEQALQFKPDQTPEQQSSKQYLAGIAKQASSGRPNIELITKLYNFLNEMDRRRSTSWRETFPWLIEEFSKYQLG